MSAALTGGHYDAALLQAIEGFACADSTTLYADTGQSVAMGRQNPFRSRSEWFMVVGAVGVLVVLLASIALRSSTSVTLPGADGSAAPTSSPDASLSETTVWVGDCDEATDPTYVCPTLPVDEPDPFEQAKARWLAGNPDPSDVRFLLLSVEEFADVLGDTLGSAELVPGDSVDSFLADNALSGTVSASWQQEWQGNFGILVEQIMILDSTSASLAVVDAWAANVRALGGSAVNSAHFNKAFPSGSLGDRSFTSTFINENAVGFFADRRCGATTIAAIDTAVLIVTVYEADDCQATQPEVSAGVVAALQARIRSLLSR